LQERAVRAGAFAGKEKGRPEAAFFSITGEWRWQRASPDRRRLALPAILR